MTVIASSQGERPPCGFRRQVALAGGGRRSQTVWRRRRRRRPSRLAGRQQAAQAAYLLRAKVVSFGHKSLLLSLLLLLA